MAVFVKKELYSLISNVYRDLEGRVIIFDIIENDVKISIAVIYAPNQDNPEFFRDIRDILKTRSEHKVIVGDFNLTLDVDLDRENTYCNNENARKSVEDMMEEFSLSDVWRIQHGDKREFSWRKKKSRPLKASRIDFSLVSAGIDQKVELTQYLTSVFTDHRAFYMCIITQPFERGTGYWKLNNTLLRNKEFIETINGEIARTLLSTVLTPPIQRWEFLKERIRKSSIRFSRMQGSQDKLILSQLSEKVDDYESRMPLTEEDDEILENTKAELEEKMLERIKGIMFRSKVKWYEEGERNSKYFFSLEKSRYNAKTCYKLIKDDGQEIIDPDMILEEQARFL